jgi:hypothetical protein
MRVIETTTLFVMSTGSRADTFIMTSNYATVDVLKTKSSALHATLSFLLEEG